ncbi:MAG: hypothetical protein AAB227_01570 [Pseudomonadota bacterium]
MTAPAEQGSARRLRLDKAARLTIGASVAVAVMAIAGVIIDNPGEIAPGEILRPALVLILFAALAPFAMFAASGSSARWAVAFPIMLFALFKFVGFYGVGEYLGLNEDEALFAGVAGMLTVCAVSAFVVSRRKAEEVAGLLFFLSATMAAGLSVLAAINLSGGGSDGEKAASDLIAAAPRPDFAAGDKPDIIYIVPDRYGNAETLARVFGRDNSGFVGALEQRGFHVEDGARSNYAKTVASLASSMNMADLRPLAAAETPASADRAPLRRMIADNAAQEILRGAGYRYMHLGTWWQETRHNPHADYEYYGVDTLWSSLSEFEHALLRTTPLAWFATRGGFVGRNECERLKNQLDYLQNARAQSDGPLFIFAHLTLPHDPITMNSDGACVKHVYYPGYGTRWDEYRAAYAGYVEHLNKRLLEIFDANAALNKQRGYIFVIQADEGPYPKRLHENPDIDMHNFTDDEIREKFGIINAIYWDSTKYGPPYLTRTPENNWRIILSKISGADVPLIKDERSLLMRSDKLVYDLKDVTATLETRH